MRIRTTLASLGILLALTSCEDVFEDGSLKPDGSTPHVIVNTPSNNQNLKVNERLRIDITASDKDNVSRIHFTVKGAAAEAPLVAFTKVLDKRVVEFDTLVSLNNAEPGTYTLAIDATDKRTNRTLREVRVTVR
jgi:hypothetical protein